MRSAQSEHPGRITLLDLDGRDTSVQAVPAALASGEPQLALRDGAAYVPRLVREDIAGRLTPPIGSATWRLELTGAGSTDAAVNAEAKTKGKKHKKHSE